MSLTPHYEAWLVLEEPHESLANILHVLGRIKPFDMAFHLPVALVRRGDNAGLIVSDPEAFFTWIERSSGVIRAISLASDADMAFFDGQVFIYRGRLFQVRRLASRSFPFARRFLE